MMHRGLVAACLGLALVGCGGAKTGEGYTSGVCKDDVTKDYAKWAESCSSDMQRRGRDGYRVCKEGAQDFLKEYPGVSCEMSGTQYGGGGYGRGGGYGAAGRIEHTTIEYYIKMMEQVGG